MLAQELIEIEELGERALQHLLDGKHPAARRLLQKLRRSPYVTESRRAEVRALAEFFRFTRNGVEARRLVRTRLSSIWGISELLTSSNFINPEVSEQTRKFIVQFTGARILLGSFTSFGPEYVCSFEALASCESDALGYFLELVPVEDVRLIKIIKVEQLHLTHCSQKYEGIIYTFPFSLVKSLPKRKDSLSNRAIDLYIEKTQRGSPDLLGCKAPIPSPALSELIHDQFGKERKETS
jgi:hypothetical protein